MANGTIVGRVPDLLWYAFGDGLFSFHTAIQRERDIRIVFRVRHDRWPAERAREKGIEYDYMRNSDLREIATWLLEHPGYPVKGQVKNNDYR